jgi:hypothetical protein
MCIVEHKVSYDASPYARLCYGETRKINSLLSDWRRSRYFEP